MLASSSSPSPGGPSGQDQDQDSQRWHPKTKTATEPLVRNQNHSSYAHGSFEPRGGPAKAPSWTRLFSDGALKFFGIVAVAGLLLPHFVLPCLRLAMRPGPAEKSGARFLPFGVGVVTDNPTNATSVTAAVLHLFSQMDWHHHAPDSRGHCVDRDEARCTSWLAANGSAAGTPACEADSRRPDAMCPRSCGLCAVALSGCHRLRVVDVDIQCTEGEQSVGQACTNHHKTRDESYCTYLPPEAGKEGPLKPKFVCAHCDDRDEAAESHVDSPIQNLLAKAEEATKEMT